MSSERTGFFLRILSVAMMIGMSACVHAAAQFLPVGQVMFWRSGIALIAILAYMAWCHDLPAALFTKRPLAHATRGVFGAFSMLCSFASLAYLPVATSQALAYLAPILTLPLAAWSLGEKIAPKAVWAVALGMGGVITILWQALQLPGPGAWIGVAAGLSYAVTMAFVRVHIKALTQTERAATISFYFAVVCTLIGLASWSLGWEPVGLDVFWSLLGAGILGGLGHIVSAEAVARSSVGNLAVYDYTGIIWAVLFDLVLFGTVPGVWSMFGMALIVLAALLPLLPRRRA